VGRGAGCSKGDGGIGGESEEASKRESEKARKRKGEKARRRECEPAGGRARCFDFARHYRHFERSLRSREISSCWAWKIPRLSRFPVWVSG